MKVALLRVGIDTGSGGIHGPLYPDGSFEFVPIPDGHRLDTRTYGNTLGRHGRPLAEYFPPGRRVRVRDQPMHVDPEFATFTYGDPTLPKRGLRHLMSGDLLIFYGGLAGYGFERAPALYIFGYFEVEVAGLARCFSDAEIRDLFGANYHVRHPHVFADQRERLVLVKGSASSRLLTRAVCISECGEDKRARPLLVLARAMEPHFGDLFGPSFYPAQPTPLD